MMVLIASKFTLSSFFGGLFSLAMILELLFDLLEITVFERFSGDLKSLFILFT